MYVLDSRGPNELFYFIRLLRLSKYLKSKPQNWGENFKAEHFAPQCRIFYTRLKTKLKAQSPNSAKEILLHLKKRAPYQRSGCFKYFFHKHPKIFENVAKFTHKGVMVGVKCWLKSARHGLYWLRAYFFVRNFE